MSPARVATAGMMVLAVGSVAAQQSPLAARHDAERTTNDAVHYDVWVRLADSGSAFEAAVTTQWKLSSSAPIRINLDGAYRITSLTLDGKSAPYRRENAGLILVTPPSGASAATTRIAYRGDPPPFAKAGFKSSHDDGLVQRGSGMDRRIFADNWPDRARKWLAAQDHPSDKATVAWTIEAPAALTVVANGTLTGTEEAGGGMKRWKFVIDQPIPVYTMVIGAARLAVTQLRPAQCQVRCVPVSVYTYPADSAWAVNGPFRRAGEMIDHFSRMIAPFPYGELRHVQTSTIFGGMENSTVIFYDEKGFQDRKIGEGLVVHETVHQWFGDAATEADWHHIWLSEGFATYGAALWAEHVDGDSALRGTMADNKVAVLRSAATERPIIDPEATDLLGLLNTNAYPKGAWVLHTLRGLVGDSTFFRGLRKYYRAHEHGTALSADFAAVMSAEAGTDLTWYFTQALTQPGYPVIAVKTSASGGQLTIELTQVQKPAYGSFRLPNLEIRVADRTIELPMHTRQARATIPWEGGQSPTVTIDPNGWWLHDVVAQ